MVQSLIQRIRENKLDALYLFINESLRDRNEFDVFFNNLMVVLPNNWSINRVEIGHEFLSKTVAVADQQQQQQQQQQEGQDNGNGNNNNNNEESKQDQLFRWVCSLESLRSLIISDGYIPRKDHGFVDTKALLRNLPRAHNLQYLDIQRLKLKITSSSSSNDEDEDDDDDTELLAESLDSLRDSLEDLRLAAISICDKTKAAAIPATAATAITAATATATTTTTSPTTAITVRYPLDAAIRVCGEMANLQLLAISCASGSCCGCNGDDNGEDQQQQQQQQQDGDAAADSDSDNNNNNSSSSSSQSPPAIKSCLISREVLLQLCRSSTTLQELALRSMRIDDDTCKTLATAFDPPDNMNINMNTNSISDIINAKNTHTHTSTLLSSSSPSPSPLSSSDDEHDNNNNDAVNSINNNHSPSFWTSLDLRQNPNIGTVGYNAILSSLERNYDLWCSLMVDNDSFQSKFNALIELNQANRGALVRSLTPEKLAVFLDRLKDDPTALWYFLTIHRDSILHPVIRYLKWKNSILVKNKLKATATTRNNCNLPEQQQQQQQQPDKQQRSVAAALPGVVCGSPTTPTATSTTVSSGIGAAVTVNNNNHKNGNGDKDQQQNKEKRPRH